MKSETKASSAGPSTPVRTAHMQAYVLLTVQLGLHKPRRAQQWKHEKTNAKCTVKLI